MDYVYVFSGRRRLPRDWLTWEEVEEMIPAVNSRSKEDLTAGIQVYRLLDTPIYLDPIVYRSKEIRPGLFAYIDGDSVFMVSQGRRRDNDVLDFRLTLV